MIDEKKLIEAIKDVEVAWYMDGNYTTYDSTTIMDIIEEQPKIGEWISCSERLPETDKNRKYLVCGEKGGIYIAEFVCNNVYGESLGMSWWSAKGRYCPNPIAWMPLPEPYKK